MDRAKAKSFVGTAAEAAPPDEPSRGRAVRVTFELYQEDPDDDMEYGKLMARFPVELFGLDEGQAVLMEFNFYRNYAGSQLRMGVEKALAGKPPAYLIPALEYVLDQLPTHALPPIGG